MPKNFLNILFLYHWHLCRGVYSFRLSVRMFVCDSVTYVESGERGGSVVECRTPEREVGGSKPTAAVLCPWARHFTPRKYWLITQEAVAPSRHDWKIVDWDVKPQHKHKQTYVEFTTKFYVHVSQVGYISPITHQKAFIFGPYVSWRVGFHSMTPDPWVHAPGWG